MGSDADVHKRLNTNTRVEKLNELLKKRQIKGRLRTTLSELPKDVLGDIELLADGHESAKIPDFLQQLVTKEKFLHLQLLLENVGLTEVAYQVFTLAEVSDQIHLRRITAPGVFYRSTKSQVLVLVLNQTCVAGKDLDRVHEWLLGYTVVKANIWAMKNVVNLRTSTVENPDGSLSTSNELHLTTEVSTYKQLCINISTYESSSRLFNPDEEMHSHQTTVYNFEAKLMDGIGKISEDCHKAHFDSTELQLTHAVKKYTYQADLEQSTQVLDYVGKSKKLRLTVAPIPSENVEGIDGSLCYLKYESSCLKLNLSQMPVKKNIGLIFSEFPIPKLDVIPVFYIERFEPLSIIVNQIAEGKSPRSQVTMRYELLRICTFRTYPKYNKPFLTKYAAAGFYYASDGDGVVCYCCEVRRYGWVEADDPMVVHIRINPRSKFIINNSEHNVPAIADGPLRKNVACIYMIPDCVQPQSPGADIKNSHRKSLGVQMAIPKHPHMAIKSVREQSFTGNWPNTSKYSPVQLTDGGFFFTGLGDCVRCFFCGIGLRHWDKEDDMWVEHARWSQNRTFLIQKKGQNFVDLVQLAVEQLVDTDLSSNTLYKNLVSEAAQKVLDQSEYTPQQIKQAIVYMLAINSNTIVTVTSLQQKVAEQINVCDTNIQRNDELGNAPEPPARNSLVNNESSIGGHSTMNEISDLKDPEDIKQENEKLKEQSFCKVCLDDIVSIVFLPCGHLVTCADCAPALRKCPICRADIKGTVRTLMK
ncbi:E3 ubiquitin-protein ligase XIAP-like isoform X2 [Dreissena polymorpha]|uniref:E3 ubiquitin-protein ligase XIAP-like isoform X2 n=1 Tax=Dreissena polymorpha TaxID=45954 RepID=UPI002264FB1A|nr:E3 ubiquitin-protein ligase XIAP-like isoform X2 [Dreissena polymorpha]